MAKTSVKIKFASKQSKAFEPSKPRLDRGSSVKPEKTKLKGCCGRVR